MSNSQGIADIHKFDKEIWQNTQPSSFHELTPKILASVTLRLLIMRTITTTTCYVDDDDVDNNDGDDDDDDNDDDEYDDDDDIDANDDNLGTLPGDIVIELIELNCTYSYIYIVSMQNNGGW